MKTPRVMLLVDADNVSPNVTEQALAHVLAAHGAAHIRRAYCTPESAVKNATLFKQLSLRPMVNLSTGKNATDIAMAVDALDLAIAERPDVAVIVSSDSDFAPLVLRLREKGCRVEGIGQQGKTAEASKAIYDAFTELVHEKPRAASRTAARAVRPARGAAGGRAANRASHGADDSTALPPPVVVAEPVRPAPPPPAAKAPRKVAAKTGGRASAKSLAAGTAAEPEPSTAKPPPRAPGRSAAAPSRRTEPPARAGTPAREALPEDVRNILAALPGLAGGAVMPLGVVAERLRAAGLLGRNAASTRLFGRMARYFVLAPAGQPNTVQFTPPGTA